MFANSRLSDGVQVLGHGKGHNVNFESPDAKNSSKVKRKRKSLKLLQRSAQDENQLVGNERIEKVTATKGKRKMDETTSLSSPRKIQRSIFNYMSSPLKIYEDSKPNTLLNATDENLKTSEKIKSCADIDREAYELMVQEEVPEQYWKEIAEQRRVALAQALQENEELHTVNAALKVEVEALKEMAEQAEYFANIVKLLTTEEEVDGDSTKTSNCIKEGGSSDTENNSEQESSLEGTAAAES